MLKAWQATVGLAAAMLLVGGCETETSASAPAPEAVTEPAPPPAERSALAAQPERAEPSARVEQSSRTRTPVRAEPAPPKPKPKPAPTPPEPRPRLDRAAAGELPVVTEPEVLKMRLEAVDDETGFAANAFPPTTPDDKPHHERGWSGKACLRCHETGVGTAPVVRHEGLTELLFAAKCRTCHVPEPGRQPTGKLDNDVDPRFNSNAFPPMMPNSNLHRGAWTIKDCLMCHDTGVGGAPRVVHDGWSDLLLRVKCRTCHVQIRSHETDPWER